MKIQHLLIFIALLSVLLLPCYTMFVVTPMYRGFIVAESEKIVKKITDRLTLELHDYVEGGEKGVGLSPDFIREARDIKQFLGLWAIKLYNPDGTLIYSSAVSETGNKATAIFLSEIKGTGEPHTRIKKRKFTNSAGSSKKLDLVESYVPIVLKGKLIAVLGVFYNLSESGNALGFLTSRSGLVTYLLTLILVVLIVFLAEKINSGILRTEQAEKKLKIYASRLEILRQLDAAILAIQTPEAIARIAIDHIIGFMPDLSVRVYSYDFTVGKSFLLAERVRAGESLSCPPLAEDLPDMDKMMRGKVFVEAASSELASFFTIKVPLLAGDDLVGSLEIPSDAEISIDDEDFQVVKDISSPLAIAIQNARLFESVDQQRRQLRNLSVRLSEMEEAERNKLAVELHDRVGQNLTALNINLNIIKSRIKAGMVAGAEVCITDSFLIVEETTRQIRDIMSELRPPNLDDHGLLAALQWYAVKRTRRSGLEIDVRGNEGAVRPGLEVEMVLFRIAQESLNNVIKHAKAHTAIVTIDGNDKNIIMSIEDDGIGFDTQQGNVNREYSSGLGIVAMQERVSALGGSFKIESSRGQGTIITVEV